MSRYIKYDAIDYRNDKMHGKSSDFIDGVIYIAQRIEDAPSIDIVFCKECKHNYNTAINHGKMQPRCDFADWKLTENDFCSRGERKESE